MCSRGITGTDTNPPAMAYVRTAAEFIYKLRPRAVVVETAVTPEHGSRPGNTISCKDRVIEGPQAFFMRMFCG
eukprot:scaffold31157_cov17-Tisochrysis_lutea.AAC.3